MSMRVIKKMIAISFALFLGMSASASTWHTGHIRTIYPLGNGNFVITFMEPIPTCSDTVANPYIYGIVGANGLTAEGANKIYSAAMASASLGQRFSVNFDETNPHCTINRAFMRIGIN